MPLPQHVNLMSYIVHEIMYLQKATFQLYCKWECMNCSHIGGMLWSSVYLHLYRIQEDLGHWLSGRRFKQVHQHFSGRPCHYEFSTLLWLLIKIFGASWFLLCRMVIVRWVGLAEDLVVSVHLYRKRLYVFSVIFRFYIRVWRTYWSMKVMWKKTWWLPSRSHKQTCLETH